MQQNNLKKITLGALVDAAITTAYIALVAWALINAEHIFAGAEPEDNLLIPIVMLMLFVVSAAITGLAVLGKPIMWYVDGKRKEAIYLLGLTIGFLVLLGLIFVSILL